MNPKPVPRWIEDVLESQIARAQELVKRDLPWAPPSLDSKASGSVSYAIRDFWLTNAICRHSPTMRRCSEELGRGAVFREAAE